MSLAAARISAVLVMAVALVVLLPGTTAPGQGVVTARLVDPHYANYFIEVTYPNGRVELYVTSSEFGDYMQGDPYP